MPLIAAFATGCLLAQLGWTMAADSSALGASPFRFAMLAAIEIAAGAAAFGGGLVLGANGQPDTISAKSCAVAFFSGVLTLTVAGAPYSLVPRLAAGEAQYAILIAACALVSVFLGALTGAAFRSR